MGLRPSPALAVTLATLVRVKTKVGALGALPRAGLARVSVACRRRLAASVMPLAAAKVAWLDATPCSAKRRAPAPPLLVLQTELCGPAAWLPRLLDPRRGMAEPCKCE